MRPAPIAASPLQYVVPSITGDPDAAFRLAEAYRELADSVATSQRRTGHVVHELSRSWRGIGHRAIDAPFETFVANAHSLVNALHDVAGELDSYGRQLAAAKQHHGLSLHKLLVLGAIVVVSGTALVVTVGASGVIEAAAASAAVGTATEAAGAATAADITAAGEIDAALANVSALRPLLAFVVPHLIQVEWTAGAMAFGDEATHGRLGWRGIAETGALAFIASGTTARGTAMAADSQWLSQAPAALSVAVPRVIEGAAWAGAAAGDDELLEHRLSLLDVSETFVLAGGSTVARDALRDRGMWPAEPDYRRDALINLLHQRGFITSPEIAHELSVLRQPLKEIQRGEIDLRIHEGPGHTIDRHISKTASELLTRVRTSRRLSVASTYWDEASARDAIQHTLSAHGAMVERWSVATGGPTTLRLRFTAPYDVGFAINARARVTFVREAVVVLRRDSTGVYLVTSYPLGAR
jgi:uncharacterized protein YukE